MSLPARIMSVESGFVQTTFPNETATDGGWSIAIAGASYRRLVAFLKARATVKIRTTNSRLYRGNKVMRHGGQADVGRWFHLDDNLDEQTPSTYRVKRGSTLKLLDLTFIGQHTEIWKHITAAVNLAPDLLDAGVDATPAGSEHYPEIEELTVAIGNSVTGKDVLRSELAKIGILTDADTSNWFWKAVEASGADGYVSYDHAEARLVNTLSPALMQRPFLPPIVDLFGHPNDALVLASYKPTIQLNANERDIQSQITFPQVALTARGIQKLDCLDELPTNEVEDVGEEVEEVEDKRGCVVS